jgi:sugar O-acyltransferase (sialic acid O-acetyltransferase NeuD family)
MSGLVIVGAGGFGREVYEIARALTEAGRADWRVEGFVDDSPAPETTALLDRLGTRLLGPVDDLLERSARIEVVLAVGSPVARRALAARLGPAGHVYPTLIHPDATLGGDVELGAGAVICPGARLSTHVSVGDHVHIDQNATVGHDTVVGAFSRLNPQACVSGTVTVGKGALVGAGATVLQGLHVGDGAVVGAGAVVVRDVAPGATVKGVPAR